MGEVRELAAGLLFPEGPVWMPDDSVLLVEIRRGTLSRVSPAGDVEVVAELGGGPNGAAVGPDGAAYVCNNGGFPWSELDGVWLPIDLATGTTQLPDFAGGWIDRVDLASRESSVLYRECDGFPFCGPNDIVFDAAGGFWFTDLGKSRPREIDRGGLYYAQPDGSSVVQVARNLFGPNGVGLSPGGDRVYVAESYTGRLLVWELEGPGRIRAGAPGPARGEVVVATKGHFDSLAVEADGHVVVAAIGDGLCVVDPDAGAYEYVTMPDRVTTNICFSGPDLRTALVTLSGSGRLVALEWPRPGLPLEF